MGALLSGIYILSIYKKDTHMGQFSELFDYSDTSMDVVYDSACPVYTCPFIGYDRFACVFFTITETEGNSHDENWEFTYLSYTRDELLRFLYTELARVNARSHSEINEIIQAEKQNNMIRTPNLSLKYYQDRVSEYIQGIYAVLEYLPPDIHACSSSAMSALRAPGGKHFGVRGYFTEKHPYQTNIISDQVRETKVLTQTDEVIRRCDFCGRNDVIHLKIPDSIFYIEARSFRECCNLETIHLPKGISIIAEATFEHCSSLTKIYIPDDVYRISFDAFRNCSALTAIKLPKSFETINNMAFVGCKALRHVFLSSEKMFSSVQTEEAWHYTCMSGAITFYLIGSDNEVYAAKAIDFCDGVPRSSFDCPSDMLTELSLFYNDLFQDDIASYANKHIGEIDELDGKADMLLKKEGDSLVMVRGSSVVHAYQFYRRCDITSTELPDNIKAINKYAFYMCCALEAINIPKDCHSIEPFAFAYCTSLKVIEIPKKSLNIRFASFACCHSLSHVFLPKNLLEIEPFAFECCFSLVNIIIPADVLNLGAFAFFLCTSLESVVLPAGLISIEPSTFKYCTSLAVINLSNNITRIGDSAFADCSSLTEIMLPTNLLQISNYTFSYCTALASVCIPNGVQIIKSFAFEYCASLVSVDLPESLVTIDWQAFQHCSSLASIRIPKNVKEIRYAAFESCIALTSIYIPNNVIDKMSFACRNCSSLSDVFVILSDDQPISINSERWKSCGSSFITFHFLDEAGNEMKKEEIHFAHQN